MPHSYSFFVDKYEPIGDVLTLHLRPEQAEQLITTLRGRLDEERDEGVIVLRVCANLEGEMMADEYGGVFVEGIPKSPEQVKAEIRALVTGLEAG